MIIETINATLFPLFLFLVFFSTACCFFYSPAKTETNRNLSVSSTSSNSESSIFINTPSDTKNEASCPSSLQIERPELLIQKQPVVEPKPLIPEAVTINTQLITLRQARTIASAIKKANPSLGIQQKVNGLSPSVKELRVQIKNRLEQAPEVVTPIILELASAASGILKQI